MDNSGYYKSFCMKCKTFLADNSKICPTCNGKTQVNLSESWTIESLLESNNLTMKQSTIICPYCLHDMGEDENPEVSTEDMTCRQCNEVFSLETEIDVLYSSKQQENDFLIYLKNKVKNDEDIIKPVDESNLTLLHTTCATGNISAIKFLIQNGADVNARTELGLNPLSYMITRNSNVGVAKILLESGTYINSLDCIGDSALVHAVNMNKLDMVKFLIHEGINVRGINTDGNCVLHTAQNVSIEIFKLLFNTNAKKLVNLENDNGYTPLTCAVAENNIDMVKLIRSNGGSTNQKNINGDSNLIHIACENNSTEVLEYLCNCGVDIDHKDAKGRSPIWRAIEKYSVDCAIELIKRGIATNVCGTDGTKLIDFAKQYRCNAIVEMIEKQGENNGVCN